VTRRFALVAALLAVAACEDRRDPIPSLSPSLSASPSPSPNLSPSPSLSPSPTPSFSSLPPPKTSHAPLRDCDPDGGGGDDEAAEISCCSEETFARVQEMAKNRSIADCKRIDRLPHIAACPTFFARGFHTAVQGCFEGAMNRELDRRLLPLKRADNKEFHLEMELQKSFNDALRETCDAVMMKEPSTGDFRGAFRCATFLMELRTEQAAAIAGAGLEATHAPAVTIRRAKRFAPFAKGLCALPAWRAGAPPSSCDDRVLGEIEDALAAAAKF
jgi:hypothetical protein